MATAATKSASRNTLLVDIDTLSPLAPAAWSGEMILSSSTLKLGDDVIWWLRTGGDDRSQVRAAFAELLESATELDRTALFCRFGIIEGEEGSGSFRKPDCHFSGVARPPRAAIDRWRVEVVGPAGSWVELDAKLCGTSRIFDVFRELEGHHRNERRRDKERNAWEWGKCEVVSTRTATQADPCLPRLVGIRHLRPLRQQAEERVTARWNGLPHVDALSPLARQAHIGSLIVAPSYCTDETGHLVAAFKATARDIITSHLYEMLQTTESRITARCRFQVVEGEQDAGSFRPSPNVFTDVKRPPHAAIHRWQVQMLAPDGTWEPLAGKIVGTPEMFDVFRELESQHARPASAFDQQDGSARHCVDEDDEPDSSLAKRHQSGKKQRQARSRPSSGNTVRSWRSSGMLEDLADGSLDTEDDPSFWIKPVSPAWSPCETSHGSSPRISRTGSRGSHPCPAEISLVQGSTARA